MADWNTTDYEHDVTNGFNHHSRESSQGSSHSDNKMYNHKNKPVADNSRDKELILRGGTELNDESRTEMSPTHLKMSSTKFSELSTEKAVKKDSGKSKIDKSPDTANSVPTEDIIIPNDANLSSFTCDQLASFFKCLKIDDRFISYLHNKGVDGKRFGKMKDSELVGLGMNNPVIVFFRNKSNVKVKGKGPFML